MHRRALAKLLLGLILSLAPAHAKESPDYGQNDAAGKYAEVNGIKLYYETYGEGDPLLLIHPNSGSISNMAPQIEEFSKHYRVIAADSRGHGKSEAGKDRLTYPSMAEDFSVLMDTLGLKQAKVIGWSDGGIVGLLLAIGHPDKVGHMAIMGANLNPAGAYDWAQEWVTRQVKEGEAQLAKNPDNEHLRLELQYFDLLGKQPDIPVESLKKIKNPVLVMAGDRDVIRTAHTVEIFEHIPKSQLLIFPGATHMLSAEDPERFNAAVSRFFTTPFRMPDTKRVFR
jgi:pimeloyl-ACP methyl ester carboxylesterase